MPLSLAPLIDPQTYEELRNTIKLALGLKRLPREAGVNVFLYLTLLYRNDHRKQFRELLDTMLSELTEDREAIDRSLRAEEDREAIDRSLAPAVRPCTTFLQEKLGVCTRHYKPYLDAFCMLNSEWQYKGDNPRARELIAWTPKAHEHLADWSERIPVEWEKAFWTRLGFRVSTENLGPLAQQLQPFYLSTPRSPNRNYHILQTVSREQKKLLFRGAIDCDIRACFSSIFWWELGGKDCEWAQIMDPSSTELMDRIRESFGCDDKGAKKLRSSLFMEYPNNYEYSTGHVWFDELHHRILGHVRSIHPGVRMHVVYTQYERLIREKMAFCGNVQLDMHDGLIYSYCDQEAAIKAVYPHQLKWEQW